MIDFDKVTAEAQDIINTARARAEGLINDAVAQAKREAETLGRPDLLEWQAKAAAIFVEDLFINKWAGSREVNIGFHCAVRNGFVSRDEGGGGGDSINLGRMLFVKEGKYRLLAFLLPLEK